MVRLKRVYERASRSDGQRVLVERLWPRGVRKEELPLFAWARGIAPSDELRRWFGHDPERWVEFKKRYRNELKLADAPGLLVALAERARAQTLTLLFSSGDTEHNNAVVLKEEIERIARRLNPRFEERSSP